MLADRCFQRGQWALALLGLVGIVRGAQASEIEIVMPGPVNVSQVQFTDRLHGVAMGIHPKGTLGSAIAWSEDGGANWNDAPIDCDVAGAEPESLFLVDGQVGWALMCRANPRRQTLLKSEDGGKSWKQQPAPELQKVRWIHQMWLDRQGKRGWINPSSGPLLATTDGAKSWKPVEVGTHSGGPFLAAGKPVPPTFDHAGMHVFSFEHLVVCGYAGIILETTDAGRTWKGQQVSLEPASDGKMHAYLNAIHFTADGRAGWAIGGEGDEIRNPNHWSQLRHPVVLFTTDGGKIWRRSKLEVRGPLNDVWAASDREAWVCGLRGYALQSAAPGCLRHTLDGGKTWINEHPGIDGLRKLFFLDAQHGWVAGGVAGGQTAESVMYRIRP